MVCAKCGTQIDPEDGWERCFECKTPIPGTGEASESSKDSLNELLMFLIPLFTIAITVILPFYLIVLFVLTVFASASQLGKHLPNTAKEIKRAFYPAVIVGIVFKFIPLFF